MRIAAEKEKQQCSNRIAFSGLFMALLPVESEF